ncbi:DUF4397 domain-containing protein [Sporanaerobium hydrogeniformans]|uniref:DUF4397 domain-containing protein n=1 Tax=Sporanaerobium hydrogeniformans TaxID=3072179 RepID=UPI0015D4AE4C|nr:DUF4397 domain-containing protein [Sporanaerobium hydrogeniformans]
MQKKEMVPQAFIRFFHAFPSGESFTLYLDEKPLAQDLLFEDFTHYFSLEPGTHTLELRHTHTHEMITTKKISVFNQKIYTCLIAPASFKLLTPICFFLEDIRRPLPDGHLVIRLGHFAATISRLELSLEEEKTLFRHISFGELSSYTAFPPGNYTLKLQEAATHTVLFTQSIKLKPYRFYSVYAVGQGTKDYPYLAILPLDGPSYL